MDGISSIYVRGAFSYLESICKGCFLWTGFCINKRAYVRACMEGVALSLRHNLEVAKEAGAEADVLRAMGGSANSLLWTQIKSDITGKPIIVPASDTATTLVRHFWQGWEYAFTKIMRKQFHLRSKRPAAMNRIRRTKQFMTKLLRLIWNFINLWHT